MLLLLCDHVHLIRVLWFVPYMAVLHEDAVLNKVGLSHAPASLQELQRLASHKSYAVIAASGIMCLLLLSNVYFVISEAAYLRVVVSATAAAVMWYIGRSDENENRVMVTILCSLIPLTSFDSIFSRPLQGLLIGKAVQMIARSGVVAFLTGVNKSVSLS